MIEYGRDSDSALTDEGTNKLIIKGLITSQQTQLHTHADTHTQISRLAQCHICICHHNQHCGPNSPFLKVVQGSL